MGFLVTVHLSHDNENITPCNYQKMSKVNSAMEISANPVSLGSADNVYLTPDCSEWHATFNK